MFSVGLLEVDVPAEENRVQVCEWQEALRVLCHTQHARSAVCKTWGTAGRGQAVVTRLKGTSPTRQERSGDGGTDCTVGHSV
jgi:hypothetical protein